jgi:hypothetical protein
MFGFPNNELMQDWAYEVADPERLVEFFDALDHYEDEPDIQFTLMDIVLQSLEEAEADVRLSEISSSIESHLKDNFELHAYQIGYWSAFDIGLEDAWRISPFLRKVWNQMKSENINP